MTGRSDYIIKDTHRGLLYRNGAFECILGAGRQGGCAYRCRITAVALAGVCRWP
jgi:hypothetical protein